MLYLYAVAVLTNSPIGVALTHLVLGTTGTESECRLSWLAGRILTSISFRDRTIGFSKSFTYTPAREEGDDQKMRIGRGNTACSIDQCVGQAVRKVPEQCVGHVRARKVGGEYIQYERRGATSYALGQST